MSCPYTPSQNGRAERKHIHITETGLAMLFHSHVPLKFWVDAFSTTTFIINCLPTPLLDNRSPFEVLFGKPHSYSNFHPFGCLVFPYLRDYAPHKLAPRSRPCVFLGYSMSHHGFRCLDRLTNQVFISRHAVFDDHGYPNKNNTQSGPLNTTSISTFLEPTATHSPKIITSSPSQPITIPDLCSSCLTDSPCSSVPTSVLHVPAMDGPGSPLASSLPTPALASAPSPAINPGPAPILGTHPMQTRAKSGIFKPSTRAFHTCLAPNSNLIKSLLTMREPKGFKTAAKHPGWIAAMDEELQALHHNHT